MSGKMKTKSALLPLFDNNGNNLRTSGSTLAMSTKMRTTITATSSSINVVRPNTLNVTRAGQNAETRQFIGEALIAWRAKARCNVVPTDRLQELFHELQLNPSEKQISEMLQGAKAFARKGSRQLNGLTFGEFCVLAADLKRFRTCNFSSSNNDTKILSSLNNVTDKNSIESGSNNSRLKNTINRLDSNNAKNNYGNSAKDDTIQNTATTDVNAPEVFLGGSCNPTTWRADVAIPTLRDLGISFYNPQVSDWTPDLIELEHRAKEKARVLFFVMDSETRASAGAIEAAHIAGQNSRHLVLVLHPYKREQSILNEPLSPQEFLDLTRNQQILRELVTRRGLPVLDNIPSGLQRTREILSGIRDPPSDIQRILKFVRGAFERATAQPSLDDEITVLQCQQALSFLGYANNLIAYDNIKNIIQSLKEILEANSLLESSPNSTLNKTKKQICVNFDEFCVLSAYLSVLQQEIHESGCISPIKGTNLPPPPIFLANMQEGIHNRNNDEYLTILATRQILRTSSWTSVPEERLSIDLFRSRDSGTSSPQPVEIVKSKSSLRIAKSLKIPLHLEIVENGEAGEESDSNDSVFSSGSSINSNFCDSFSGTEFRDVYLGGSCYLRTNWRQEYAIPYLNGKNITYHLPALHESILPSQLEGNKYDSSNNSSSSKGKSKVNRSIKNTQQSDLDKNLMRCCSGDDYQHESSSNFATRPNLYNPTLLDSSRVLLFVITNETRSLAPMTLAAHCIGLMYNVVLCVQMLPEFCIIGNDRLTPAAIKDYNRGRSYLIDLAKRQGVPVFNDLKSALECTIEKVKASNSRNSV